MFTDGQTDGRTDRRNGGQKQPSVKLVGWGLKSAFPSLYMICACKQKFVICRCHYAQCCSIFTKSFALHFPFLVQIQMPIRHYAKKNGRYFTRDRLRALFCLFIPRNPKEQISRNKVQVTYWYKMLDKPVIKQFLSDLDKKAFHIKGGIVSLQAMYMLRRYKCISNRTFVYYLSNPIGKGRLQYVAFGRNDERTLHSRPI